MRPDPFPIRSAWRKQAHGGSSARGRRVSREEQPAPKSHPTTSCALYDVWGEEIESPSWCADPGETPEERLLRDELTELLEDRLERLSPEQRTTIVFGGRVRYGLR